MVSPIATVLIVVPRNAYAQMAPTFRMNLHKSFRPVNTHQFTPSKIRSKKLDGTETKVSKIQSSSCIPKLNEL